MSAPAGDEAPDPQEYAAARAPWSIWGGAPNRHVRRVRATEARSRPWSTGRERRRARKPEWAAQRTREKRAADRVKGRIEWT